MSTDEPNGLAQANRPAAYGTHAGAISAEPEEDPGTPANPVVIVALGSGAAAGVEACDTLRAPDPAPRPVGVASLTGQESFDEAWRCVEPALAACLGGLSLDPHRRLGMQWDVVLVGDPRLRAGPVTGLLQGWYERSLWPLRVTVLLDASEVCRPWLPAAQDESPGTWEGVLAEVESLESWAGNAPVAWNGCYLIGRGNRFGFVNDSAFRELNMTRLLSLCVESDLLEWLQGLPTLTPDGAGWEEECSGVRLSAIGCSSLWHPDPPWTRPAVAIQGHWLAHLYGTAPRLAPHAIDCWAASHLDCAGVGALWFAKVKDQVLQEVWSPADDPCARCRELLALASEREDRCVQPALSRLAQEAGAWLNELERRLGEVGQQLVLAGGVEAFAVILERLEGRLALMVRDLDDHQAEVRELLRSDALLLADLLSAARRGRYAAPASGSVLARWWQGWRRRRWLRRTARTLERVLAWEVLLRIDSCLRDLAARAGELVRQQRRGLDRFRADLQTAGADLLGQAKRSFLPPAPTDLPGVSFEAAVDRVRKAAGTAASPLPSLADVVRRNPEDAPPPSWHEWDAGLLREALLALAERGLAEDRRAGEELKDIAEALLHEGLAPAALADLACLSHPLVPVPAASYDANPQHVFRRWFVPEARLARWRSLPLPGGSTPVAAKVTWPSVVTVYRDLPLAPSGGRDMCPGT